MPKIVKPVKYKRTPDGRFAKKDAPARKFSTKNWQCKKPIEKTLNLLNGELRYKISKKYPMEGAYIQIMELAAIEDKGDAFIARTAEHLLVSPHMKTYRVRFWGEVTEYELKDGPGVYHVLHGGFEVLEETPYAEVLEHRYGKTPESQIKGGNIGVDNNGVGNIGRGNFGYHNYGLENYGEFNKGVHLMGLFNTCNSGFFMFNNPVVTSKGWWEIQEAYPAFLLGLTSPENENEVREAFEKASQQDKWGEEHAKLLALPNFDYKIFEEITGISKQELDKSYDAWYKRTHSLKRKHK